MSKSSAAKQPQAQATRFEAIRDMLHKRYNGVIPVTDEMVRAVLDALDKEG